MSEKKVDKVDKVDQITEGMSNVNMSDGKKAIVTIGRWQPPHSGHSNLIGVVISDVVKERKAGKNTLGYIYISPRPDESRGGIEAFLLELSQKLSKDVNPNKKLAEILSKNPLTQIQKWYYLNLMYPRLPANVKFLMIEYPTNRTIASFLLDGYVRESNFEWNQYGKDYEYDIRSATIPEFVLHADRAVTARSDTGRNARFYEKNYIIMKMLYRRKREILKQNVLNWHNKTQKIISTHQVKSSGDVVIPSVTCINYLKNAAKVKQIEIVVGSDRVDAFRRYNQGLLDQLPEGGEVRQAGRDRGSVGDGMIAEPVKRVYSLNNEEEEEKVEKAFASCTATDERGPCSSEEEVRDGVFSGTILRDCVKALKCNVESKGSERPLDYFIRGVLVGNMTPLDAFCLFMDIILNLGYDVVSIEQYNNLVSDEYKISYDELMTGGRKRKTRRKKGKGTIFSRRRNKVGKIMKNPADDSFWEIIRHVNTEVHLRELSSGSGGTDDSTTIGPIEESALKQAGWKFEKSEVGPGGTQSGGRRKTRKRGRVPIKYVPKRLTRKDKKKARRELKKSRKAYKKGKYYTRKKVKSFKSKKSNHVINAMKIYGVKSVSASPKLAKKSGCSVTGLKKLVSKGAGAYYSSGSRPNQTAISWGRARMASAITGGKAAAVDFKILEKYCKPSSKALKLAKQAKKKHGFGTRKVRKVKL